MRNAFLIGLNINEMAFSTPFAAPIFYTAFQFQPDSMHNQLWFSCNKCWLSCLVFFPVFPEILPVKVWSVSIWFVHCVWRSYRRISLNLVIIYGRVCLDQSILLYGNLIRFELDVAFYINAQMHLEFVWGGGDKHADLRNT